MYYITYHKHKIKLIKRGKGSYVMRVKLLSGGEEDKTVDSGAEESVCPWFGSSFLLSWRCFL